MTTVVKTAHAQDFLALVPQLVGFPPVNSVVFVAFRGKRTCAAIRFDLPSTKQSRVHEQAATTIVGMLSRLPDVDAVVPVVYTDDAIGATRELPHAGFVSTAMERFRFSGFRVRDALCVAADGWASYLDDDRPPGGRPLSAIVDSRVLDAVPPERLKLGDLDRWSTLPEVDAAVRTRVARRLARFRAVRDRIDTLSRAQVTGREGVDRDEAYLCTVLDDLTLSIELLRDVPAEEITERVAALVAFVVASPGLRDVVMMQWAFDLDTGDRVYQDMRRFQAGESAESLATGGLMMGQGERPDPARVECAIGLVRQIAAMAPRRARPPLLCMLAWLHWALGRSTVAGRFVGQATDIDAGYGFAEVLTMMLDRALLPEWAYALPADDSAPGPAGPV